MAKKDDRNVFQKLRDEAKQIKEGFMNLPTQSDSIDLGHSYRRFKAAYDREEKRQANERSKKRKGNVKAYGGMMKKKSMGAGGKMKTMRYKNGGIIQHD